LPQIAGDSRSLPSPPEIQPTFGLDAFGSALFSSLISRS
jgi:hypothetical protein